MPTTKPRSAAPWTRRSFLRSAAAAGAAGLPAAHAAPAPLAPTWASLVDRYRTPGCFRSATPAAFELRAEMAQTQHTRGQALALP